MRITIIAIGTRGDVQPYIALGKGLQQAGHQVRLAAQINFDTFVTGHGLEFAPIAGHAEQLLANETGQALMATGYDGLRYMRLLAKVIGPTAQQGLLDSWQACQNAETIIFNTFGVAGYHIAEKLRVPVFGAYIYPLSRTRAFPTIGTIPWLKLGGSYNWITHLISEQVIWHTFRQVINQWRQETLGLPPLPWSGPYPQMHHRGMPVLYAYSPAVVPKPPDWPDWLIVTGYWFLDRPAGWQPPADLVEFLEIGPPPVYVGFGSISNRNPTTMLDLVVEALKETGQRGILAKGWGGLRTDVLRQRLPDDIFVVDTVPHDWLFPRMAAVVHHGGSGSTGAGLRAGVPSIIVPFHLDQPFWGQRVADLGAGPAPIPHHKLTPRRLAAAIHTAVTDQTMQARAADLGQQIRAEDGLARAIEAFEQYL